MSLILHPHVPVVESVHLRNCLTEKQMFSLTIVMVSSPALSIHWPDAAYPLRDLET